MIENRLHAQKEYVILRSLLHTDMISNALQRLLVHLLQLYSGFLKRVLMNEKVLLNLLRSDVSARSTLMQSSTSDALSVKKLHHDVLVARRRCPIGMSSILPWI